MTPAALVTAIITERGVVTGGYATGLAALDAAGPAALEAGGPGSRG